MSKALLILTAMLFPVWVYAAAPSIFSSPAYAINDTEVTIKSGYPGFGQNQGVVYLDGNLIDVIYWDDDKVTFRIPVSLNPGSHNLTVRNSTGEESRAKQIITQYPPEIFSISPTGVYPGVTRMCIVGNNFGTPDTNWSGSSADSDIKVGGIEVTSASWANNQICFQAPNEARSGSVTLRIRNYSLSKSFYVAVIAPGEYAKVRANDTYLQNQYYLGVLNAYTGWQAKAESPNVVVAIIDDGIYINHPDLKENIWTNKNEVIGNKVDDDKNGYVDDIYGWNFVGGSGEMTVRGSHGTHVAGIIGAIGNNGYGIAGISWNVKLMPIIACDEDGCSTSSVTKAIKYAADNGANVVNLSLTSVGTTKYSEEYNEAIRYAYNKGAVLVAAAGNGDVESASSIGLDLSNVPQSPVCNDLSVNAVLGVSAVDDQRKAMRWANYGRCVDVYAPGTKILSAAVPVLDDSFFSSTDGTSFSAPMVSGLAALLKGKYPQITNREIIDLIIQNSKSESGAKTIDIGATLYASYSPSGIKPFVAGSTGTPPPLSPTPPPSSNVKNLVESKPKTEKTSKESVFAYDSKLATSINEAHFATNKEITLRACPSNTCDPKGIYPNESSFIANEKYGDKNIWYRGQTPDGNSGWVSAEFLKQIEISREISNTIATTSPKGTSSETVINHPPKRGLWAKIISWFKFWD